MRTFKQFKDLELTIIEDVEYEFALNILSEELHQKLQEVLDSDTIPVEHKLSTITRNVRSLISSGQDTGLESDKPKKGSSRAVFFPREEKKITIDGKEASIPTAVKIAFKSQLDRHTGSDMLLGEHQNQLESDGSVTHSHSVLRKIGDGHFETNPNGVLMPVLSSHPESHYLEAGKVEKYNAKDLRNYTKNKEFPKGLSHSEVFDALNREYKTAHGEKSWSSHSDDHLDKVIQHPHVENMIDMMHFSGMHPGDLNPRNMGIWVHPHTGVRHPVIIDYGFSNEISKLYSKARRVAYHYH